MPVARIGAGGAIERPQLIRQASIYLLEQRLIEAGLDPSPIWLTHEGWDGLGAHLDAWIDATAAALAPALVACTAVIDVEAVVIDGACPPEVRRRIVTGVVREAARLDGGD